MFRHTMQSGRIPVAALLALCLAGPAAAADPVAGENVFKKCAACHQVGDAAKNRVGPVLNGIVGRAAGQIADFKYSDAMLGSGLTWDEATLSEYLRKPKDLVKGTKMAFAGLKDESDVTNVIAYLATYAADGTRK
ncbi:cytochrome c family protein [Aestuariivirga sp.]|uniref:c-type cytochrome n=1 Tax=Aestuariivirga sp. TaxID=2650926 RepID=UPI003593BF43